MGGEFVPYVSDPVSSLDLFICFLPKRNAAVLRAENEPKGACRVPECLLPGSARKHISKVSRSALKKTIAALKGNPRVSLLSKESPGNHHLAHMLRSIATLSFSCITDLNGWARACAALCAQLYHFSRTRTALARDLFVQNP